MICRYDSWFKWECYFKMKMWLALGSVPNEHLLLRLENMICRPGRLCSTTHCVMCQAANDNDWNLAELWAARYFPQDLLETEKQSKKKKEIKYWTSILTSTWNGSKLFRMKMYSVHTVMHSVGVTGSLKVTGSDSCSVLAGVALRQVARLTLVDGQLESRQLSWWVVTRSNGKQSPDIFMHHRWRTKNVRHLEAEFVQ